MGTKRTQPALSNSGRKEKSGDDATPAAATHKLIGIHMLRMHSLACNQDDIGFDFICDVP